jgi:D-glycero-alpha-D-manno-heptose-7-phosphate kinase
MIIVRTPFRISFFGGGTDYPSWYRENGGAVLATTINKYCYISCRYLPQFFEHKHRIVYSRIEAVSRIADIEHPAVRGVLGWTNMEQGLEIHHDGDLPARSGLGSSSSFTVGLLHAIATLRGQYVGAESLAQNAIHVEQNVIGENVGSQDQISAAYGGFNKIEFLRNGGFRVNPVIIESPRSIELQSHLMLCFTGISRIASEVAKSKIENFANRQKELHAMRAMVDDGMRILQDSSIPIEEFGAMLHESWVEKRKLSDKVSSSEIDRIYEEARKAGAIGGKLLGAGGGGFLLLFVQPEKQPKVRERLKHLVHVPIEFDYSGSRVVLYQPNGL